MPPKRKSAGSSGPASKKTKTAAPATPAKPAETYKPPRSERWAAVSGSANAEAFYRMVWKDEEKAYSYITICSLAEAESDDEEDDDDSENSNDEEDEEEDEERQGLRCGKKRCMCFKPAAANPEHPWAISVAGLRKFETQFVHAGLRDPDNFSMYTFNDHAGYGSLEVLQNLLLDFADAAAERRGEWREQWAACEAAAHWLMRQSGSMFTQIDDAVAVQDTMRLVGRMFLAMLAQLDALALVGDATAVQSLGCTMAQYMALASTMRSLNALGSAPRRAYGARRVFQPDYFDDAVLAYANARGVTLRGPADIEEVVADAVAEVALPASGARDPWGWRAALAAYRAKHAAATMWKPNGPRKIGGDAYDITTWESSERKAAAFDNKDPLKKRDIDALKEGLVMQMR
ncbi:hypothetical protein GGS24DRAFT_321611 [Hypoxylon argillaceum]|nr:hypothetical protein GGS24DRAFT_321611 [Hypoxylon argillaceum]